MSDTGGYVYPGSDEIAEALHKKVEPLVGSPPAGETFDEFVADAMRRYPDAILAFWPDFYRRFDDLG